MIILTEAEKLANKVSSMRRVSRDRHTEEQIRYLAAIADRINGLPHDEETLDNFLLRDIKIPEWFARLLEPSKVCIDPSNQYVCNDFKTTRVNPETLVAATKAKTKIDIAAMLSKPDFKFDITKFQEALYAVAGSLKTSVNYVTDAKAARKVISFDAAKDCILIADTVIHSGAADYNPVALSVDLYKESLTSGDSIGLYQNEWFRRIVLLAANEDPNKI